MSDAGLQIEEIRVDEPTLENTFVATLRALGQEPMKRRFVPPRSQRTTGRVAIDADNLVKQFGTFAAVKGVSLQVRHGEVYVLLGANGAGKTTTIKMLCGLLEPTVGEVHSRANAACAPAACANRSAICRKSFRYTTTSQ